ncbi:MAG: hypothetical protein NZ805_01270 [Armatimonadetes bacterium]|nr:hypothetical protein [Armatimonadota bacterium]
MTVDEIVREVEKQLGELDERAKEAVKLAVKLAQGETLPEQDESQWQGENPPFEEMAKLEMMERSKVMWELKRINQKWLLRQCEKLKAGWLIVVDGKVLKFGPSMAWGWSDEELLAIAQQTGKLPLIFIHPRLLMIEETAWATIDTFDAYPTLPVTLKGVGGSLTLVADFDTGALGLFTDYEQVMQQNLVQFTPADQWQLGEHLGQPFFYCPKPVVVALIADDGTERSVSGVDIFCVLNWGQSPFVSVNPNRTALIGRDICLLLQPKITLNFEAKMTSVAF